MKQVSKIDTNGFLLETILIDDGTELSSDLIETTCPNGFYRPKWDGSAWVEGETADEVQKDTQISNIKSQLAALDPLLPRCMEDLISSRSIDVTTLPQIMQDRLKQKQDLRSQFQSLSA